MKTIFCFILLGSSVAQANIPQVWTAPIDKPFYTTVDPLPRDTLYRIRRLERAINAQGDYILKLNKQVQENTRAIQNHGHSTFSRPSW